MQLFIEGEMLAVTKFKHAKTSKQICLIRFERHTASCHYLNLAFHPLFRLYGSCMPFSGSICPCHDGLIIILLNLVYYLLLSPW